MMYLSALVCVVTLQSVLGNPSGAPGSACDNMTPGHGFSAQVGAAPYTIAPSSGTYRCGESITVTLSATSGNFRGFLCQARTDVAAYSSTVGTLAQTGSVTMNQNCGAGRALTHSENGDKTSAQFTWTPAADHGSVQIVCTFVQVKATYWVKETSSALTYAGNCGASANPTGSTGSTVAGTTTPNAAGYMGASIGLMTLISLAYYFV